MITALSCKNGKCCYGTDMLVRLHRSDQIQESLVTSHSRHVKPGPSAHEQIASVIRADIYSGRLRDGDTIRSNRELVREFGVSQSPINKAMKTLVAEGLIESKPRSKRVVRAPEQARRSGITRTTSPQLVLIGGFAGSGKTELGRVLAHKTGWALIDKDTVTRPVVELALETLGCSPHDRESEVYLEKVRPAEYEALAAAIQENLECRANVIVSAPHLREFADPAWLTRMQATVTSLGATLTVVWVYCDADTMHTYIRRRGAARDTTKLADWSGYLDKIDVTFRPGVPHQVIDNSGSSRPLQDQAKELVKLILTTDEEGEA